MDILSSKDDKIRKLEKRMSDLEAKTFREFSRRDEAFETFRKIVLNLQKENTELKKDRDFLLGKYKEAIRRMGVEPVKKMINENASLIREIATEDLDIENGKSVDDLFGLVMNSRKVSLKSAARNLGVSEKKTRYWALKLKKQGLIDVNEKVGGIELRKAQNPLSSESLQRP